MDRRGTGLEEAPRLDPVTTALQLAFYFLFAVSVWEFYRRRGQLELSVVAIFGSIAALFTLTFVNALLPVVAPLARPVLIAILFAQPYLVLRLINQIRPVAAIRMRIGLLAGRESARREDNLPGEQRQCSLGERPPAPGCS